MFFEVDGDYYNSDKIDSFYIHEDVEKNIFSIIAEKYMYNDPYTNTLISFDCQSKANEFLERLISKINGS